MIKEIKFIGRTGLFENPSFLIADNEDLTLKLNLPNIRDGKFVLKLKHGENEKTFVLSAEKTCDVSAEWLKKTGAKPLELFLELRDETGTKIITRSAKTRTDRGGYFIEPLKIEEVEDGWSASAFLQLIENEIKNLKQTCQNLDDRISSFEENGIPLIIE